LANGFFGWLPVWFGMPKISILPPIRRCSIPALRHSSQKLGDNSVVEHKNWLLAHAMAAQNSALAAISDIKAGRVLEKLLKNTTLNRKLQNALWNYASREFARRANGTVTIFCDGARLSSTFRMVEAYEIINNPKVTHVRLMHYQGENAPYTMQAGTKDLLKKFFMDEELLSQIGERAYLIARDELQMQFKLRGEDSCLTRYRMDGLLKTLSDGLAQICDRAVVSAGCLAPHTPA
jgi:hypothetical protein